MPAKILKGEMLELISHERWKLETELGELNGRQMIQRGVCGEWSAKDLMAHLAEWEQMFLGWYAAGRRGEAPEAPGPGLTWGRPDMARLNDEIFQKHRRRPLAEVLDWFEASYEQILAMMQAVPEADLWKAGRYAWLKTVPLGEFILADTAHHYRWARQLIRKWRRAQQAAKPAERQAPKGQAKKPRR
jgi:hypothetical protein